MKSINITIPKDMLKDLDRFCKKLGFNRSEFIRALIRNEVYYEKRGDNNGKMEKKQ